MENGNRKVGWGEFARGLLDSTSGLVWLILDVLIHGESSWEVWCK